MKRIRITATLRFDLEIIEPGEDPVKVGGVISEQSIEISAVELNNYQGALSDMMKMKLESAINPVNCTAASLEFASLWRQNR